MHLVYDEPVLSRLTLATVTPTQMLLGNAIRSRKSGMDTHNEASPSPRAVFNAKRRFATSFQSQDILSVAFSLAADVSVGGCSCTFDLVVSRITSRSS
jgi:hypothetical protein